MKNQSRSSMSLAVLVAIAVLAGSLSAQFPVPLPNPLDKKGGKGDAKGPAKSIPFPTDLFFSPLEGSDYASMERYKTPCLGKIMYIVDRCESLETEKTRLASEAAEFLFQRKANAAQLDRLKQLDGELEKATNPQEKERVTIERRNFVMEVATGSNSLQRAFEADEKKLLEKQAVNAKAATGIGKQQASAAMFGIMQAAEEAPRVKESFKGAAALTQIPKITADISNCQTKLDGYKKDAAAFEAKQKQLEAAYEAVCKEQSVAAPTDATVTAKVKELSNVKLKEE